MEEKAKPDYARCVDISTAAALKEMILPEYLHCCTSCYWFDFWQGSIRADY